MDLRKVMCSYPNCSQAVESIRAATTYRYAQYKKETRQKSGRTQRKTIEGKKKPQTKIVLKIN